MSKSRDAFRTISEVAELLDTPAHVLRFWESKFTQVKPVKRAGGRRYYRPGDIGLLAGIKQLLHEDGLTIKGVQKVLREQGVKHVSSLAPLMLEEEDDADMIEDAPFTEAEPETGTILPFAPLDPTVEPAAAPPDALRAAEEMPDAVPEPAAEAAVAEAPDAVAEDPVAEAAPELEALADAPASDAEPPEAAFAAEVAEPAQNQDSDAADALPEAIEPEAPEPEPEDFAPFLDEAPSEGPGPQPDLFTAPETSEVQPPEEAVEPALPDFLNHSLEERLADSADATGDAPVADADPVPDAPAESLLGYFPVAQLPEDLTEPESEAAFAETVTEDPAPDAEPVAEAAAPSLPPEVPALADLPAPAPGVLALLAGIDRLNAAQARALAPHVAGLRHWVETRASMPRD